MDDPGHMTPDEFRRCGAEMIERIARYMEEVEDYPVLSRAAPGSVRALLPRNAPEHGEPFADVLRDVDRIIMPGITHWQSPGFFAYFPANASGPAILGDLLSSGLGVQGMLWATSPACTELEAHVLDWLVDLLGLPDRFRSSTAGGGVIQDSASSSTLTALLAARERASGGAVNEQGLGRDNLRLVHTDGRHAMRVDAADGHRRGSGRGHYPGDGLRHRRHHLVRRRGPGGSAPSAAASGWCTSPPPMPAATPSAPSSAASSTGLSTPTALHQLLHFGIATPVLRRKTGVCIPDLWRSPPPR